MQSNLTEITYDIELRPGEMLSLPKDAANILGPGHWLVTIKPVQQSADGTHREGDSTRDHTAFLNSYVTEDEGLYNDYSAR